MKQNAEILLEVSQNYEGILAKKTNASKEEIEKYELYLKNFKNQFLYLLTSLHKMVENEKNAK